MDWQQIAAFCIVVGAFLWLLRTQLFGRRKSTGCGGCHGCASAPAAPPSLIPADELAVLPSSNRPATPETADKVGTADARR
jgi:hypothetical protein